MTLFITYDGKLKSWRRIIKDIEQIKIEYLQKSRIWLEQYYHKPVKVSNFWSNNYILYESNGDRNKTLLVKEYLNKIRPYLKDIINNLKKPGTFKI